MLVVGISDLKLAKPPDQLITYALGSCVGICLFDPSASVSGLSHIMLPKSSLSPSDRNVFKFADTAIPDLVQKMERMGASRSRIKAKIAGGAQMFQTSSEQSNNAMWQIGQRNVASVTETLRKLGIPIIAQDVLKNFGRTVSFNPANNVMTVKAINQPPKDY